MVAVVGAEGGGVVTVLGVPTSRTVLDPTLERDSPVPVRPDEVKLIALLDAAIALNSMLDE
jgi:hypothetical protein